MFRAPYRWIAIAIKMPKGPAAENAEAFKRSLVSKGLLQWTPIGGLVTEANRKAFAEATAHPPEGVEVYAIDIRCDEAAQTLEVDLSDPRDNAACVFAFYVGMLGG